MLEEKRKLVRGFTEVFVRNLDVAPDAVTIQIIEGPKRLSAKRRASAQRSTGSSL
jgi:phenylpyruvate tautomerase PptA (4-oxalocrotonate tautomerase family)